MEEYLFGNIKFGQVLEPYAKDRFKIRPSLRDTKICIFGLKDCTYYERALKILEQLEDEVICIDSIEGFKNVLRFIKNNKNNFSDDFLIHKTSPLIVKLKKSRNTKNGILIEYIGGYDRLKSLQRI